MLIKSYFIFFLLFLIITRINSKGKKFISIPFFIKKINANSSYNSTQFLKDFFLKEIILQFNIGTPFQKVNGILDEKEEDFKFKLSKIYNDNNNRYCPNLSSSAYKSVGKLMKDKINFKDPENDYFIYFSLEYGNYKNPLDLTYLPVLGLKIPDYYDTSSKNLIIKFKKEGIINKLIWTIEYINNYEGNLILGEELSVYDGIKYPKYKNYNIYYKLKYFINFDSVYIEDKKYNNIDNNNITRIFMNETQIMINLKSGFILAPNEFRTIINKYYFNDLFNKNICQADTVNYEFNNKVNFEYLVYSCSDASFINYYKNFPNLIFSLKSIEHNFEFNNSDLFQHISDRFYFLIIFQKTTNKKDIIWYFGEPFYKKYFLSINFDSKSIGFYLEKDKSYKETKNDDNYDVKNDLNKKSVKRIVKFIIDFLILVFLIIIIYFIVISIKEKRKKRTNELKDDNYEYMPKNDININDSKKRKFIELNSRLGI